MIHGRYGSRGNDFKNIKPHQPKVEETIHNGDGMGRKIDIELVDSRNYRKEIHGFRGKRYNRANQEDRKLPAVYALPFPHLQNDHSNGAGKAGRRIDMKYGVQYAGLKIQIVGA
jgi:hypothetical protein